MGWDKGVLLLFVDILPIIIGCYMLYSQTCHIFNDWLARTPWTVLVLLMVLCHIACLKYT